MTFSTKLLAAAAVTVFSLGAAAVQAQDFKAGDILVRGRIINVNPSNGGWVDGGGKAFADTDTVPEVDGSYFVTDNIALELIAATTKHDVKLKNAGSSSSLGDTYLLPPTLTVQYHKQFNDFKPYVGAGLTYAHFYDSQLPGGTIEYDDAWGAAFQAGVDYKLTDKVFFNADVKKIFVSTDVTVNGTTDARARLNPTIVGVGIGYKF